MNKYFKTATALFVVMAVAGCATTGNQSTAGLSEDQKALRDNSAEYAATGAVAGAVLGCVLGILISNDKAAGCAGGAAVGGVTAGAGGYYVAQQQQQAGQAKTGINQAKNDLASEVARLRKLAQTSKDVSVSTQAEIRQLQQQVAAGHASKAQLAERVRVAEEDRKFMSVVSGNLQNQINRIDESASTKDLGKLQRAELAARRDELVREKRALDQTIQDLAGVTGSA